MTIQTTLAELAGAQRALNAVHEHLERSVYLENLACPECSGSGAGQTEDRGGGHIHTPPCWACRGHGINPAILSRVYQDGIDDAIVHVTAQIANHAATLPKPPNPYAEAPTAHDQSTHEEPAPW